MYRSGNLGKIGGRSSKKPVEMGQLRESRRNAAPDKMREKMEGKQHFEMREQKEARKREA